QVRIAHAALCDGLPEERGARGAVPRAAHATRAHRARSLLSRDDLAAADAPVREDGEVERERVRAPRAADGLDDLPGRAARRVHDFYAQGLELLAHGVGAGEVLRL